MRKCGTREDEEGSMAEEAKVVLDRSQVKKAVQGLQAFLRSNSTADRKLLGDTEPISLLFTLWKIPKVAQTIRIPLPHGQRTDDEEVCLFTRDEPKMTSEQTQRFYKKLLEESGVKNVTEIIPYKVLKTEYKPYEAKLRLLGNFDTFISDDRIRRLLPSHLGKHFYARKREPLCVNLQSKQLARDIQKIVQGTCLKVNNKGSCCMARVGHSDMTADEVTDNIETTVQTVAAKLRMKGPMMKLIHLKSNNSVALPIYTSDLNHLVILQDAAKSARKAKATAKKQEGKTTEKNEQTETSTDGGKEVEEEKDNAEVKAPEEEESTGETPSKKPKLQRASKKKPAGAKKKVPGKLAKKAGTGCRQSKKRKVK